MPGFIQAPNNNQFQNQAFSLLSNILMSKMAYQQQDELQSKAQEARAQQAAEARQFQLETAGYEPMSQEEITWGSTGQGRKGISAGGKSYKPPEFEYEVIEKNGRAFLRTKQGARQGITPLSSEKESDTWDQLTPVNVQGVTLYPQKNRTTGKIEYTQVKPPSSQSVTVNTGEAKPTLAEVARLEAAKTLGKTTPEVLDKYSELSQTARGNLEGLQGLEKTLEGVKTGAATPIMMSVARWSKAFGVDIDPNLPKKQQADALLNQIALQLRNPAGGAGMPGQMSDKDREFLVKAAGSVSSEPETLKGIINIRKKLLQRQIDEAREASRYIKQTGYRDENFNEHMAEWATKNPIFTGNEIPTKTVVRRGIDSAGRRVIQLEDGTIEYAD